jgi:hypothetical protein
LWAAPLQIRVVDDGVDEGEDPLCLSGIHDQLELLLESLGNTSRYIARDVHPPLFVRGHCRSF